MLRAALELCGCWSICLPHGLYLCLSVHLPIYLSIHPEKIDDIIVSRDDATKVRGKCLIGMSEAGDCSAGVIDSPEVLSSTQSLPGRSYGEAGEDLGKDRVERGYQAPSASAGRLPNRLLSWSVAGLRHRGGISALGLWQSSCSFSFLLLVHVGPLVCSMLSGEKRRCLFPDIERSLSVHRL